MNRSPNPKAPITIRPIATRTIFAATATAMLAACVTPPPPPPPVAEAVPYRPLPPAQSSYQMVMPHKDALGVRQTINTSLGQDEAAWHFRSGWNVAALNCTRDIHQPILDGYATMLRQEASMLTGVNTRVEAQFRASTGGSRRDALLARETHSTEMYNYFASPSARAQFCNTALAIANEYLTTQPADFMSFAVTGLQRYELAFEQFYTAYEQYQASSAEWDARYGAQYGPSQPGWVAIYGNSTQ